MMGPCTTQENGRNWRRVLQEWKTRLDWDDLRYFLGVARSGSLTRTAAELRVSQSTVSRRIESLETSLGTRLFARHQTGYFLTDQGRNVLRQAEAVGDSINALELRSSGLDANASGTVRLATAENLATHLIIPALPLLAERAPGIRLEIVTGIGTVELSRHEADVALRLVRPLHGNLRLRKIGVMASAVFGSAEYLRRHIAPKADPLAGRAFITWDDAFAHLPSARWLARTRPAAESALVTTSVAMQLAAVRAGLGLAVLPCFLAEAAGLIPVIPSADVLAEDLWLVTHADLSASARIRIVGNFLADAVSAAWR